MEAVNHILMKGLQLNLNNNRIAQNLLAQTVREEGVDVAFVCEQNHTPNSGEWIADLSNRAAIWTCKSISRGKERNRVGVGYVHAEIAGIHCFSCYASPNDPLEEYEAFLQALVTDARPLKPLIIAGDFNAWAVEWGSRTTNNRGNALLEAFATLDLILANEGRDHTFTGGTGNSIIDLTFISPDLQKRGITWNVSQGYTHSDHQAILWEVNTNQEVNKGRKRLSAPLWKVGDYNEETYKEALRYWKPTEQSLNITNIDEMVEVTMQWITRACDTSMRRTGTSNNRPSVHWWNDTIAELRRRCHQARRQYQRNRTRHGNDHEQTTTLRTHYLDTRRELRREIFSSKKECWRVLCEELNADPWGKAYQIVTKKLHSQQPLKKPEEIANIINHLFPSNPRATFHMEDNSEEDGPPLSKEEVLSACRRIGVGKAPGLDKIPNRAIKSAINTFPDFFVGIYNRCIREGIFPSKWKRQRLVLLPKPGKPLGELTSYRPLCMLDTAGKTLEKLIQSRLSSHIEPLLEPNQFGFRAGKSAIDAVEEVIKIGREKITGPLRKRRYCLVVALDIKNAFNTAKWDKIWEALNMLKIPRYLRKIIASYLSDRTLIADTTKGAKEYSITTGVPQGSVLGPTLWNILYNGLLKTQMPNDTILVAFADDVAATITAKTLEDIEYGYLEVMNRVRQWMNSVGLTLALEKTEAVLITGKKVKENIQLTFGGYTIRTQPHIKYLGIILDQRLNLKEHLKYAGGKAGKAETAIARILPNVGGPRQSRRKVITNVTTSILLYGAPVWRQALDTSSYLRLMEPVHRRSALRITSAYRTTSGEAAHVLAGIPPIKLLAEERVLMRNRANQRREQQDSTETEREIKELIISKWQEEWDMTTKGRWTHRLIPLIRPWFTRAHGEVNYHLTQVLSGHGGFREYLHRVGVTPTPDCHSCPGEAETAEHVLLKCNRFKNERENLEHSMREPLTETSYVATMLRTQEDWDNGCKFAYTIMQKLSSQERADKQEQRIPSTGS